MPRSRSRSPRRRSEYSPRRGREYPRADGPSSRGYSPRVRDDGRTSNLNEPPRRAGRRDDPDRDRGREDNRRRRYSRSRSPKRRDDERRERDSYPAAGRRRSRSHSHSRPASPGEKPKPKLEPNFNNSGLLAAATNAVEHGDGTSTVLKYNEPPEARKPPEGWRIYVFKGKEQVDLLHIYRQSAYLIGRDRAVADIHTEHPSCSKQHAALQFRQVTIRNEFGDTTFLVKPFIIDLESTNSTFVNDVEIPPSRYYELHAGDVIKFGMSVREYVILNEDGV